MRTLSLSLLCCLLGVSVWLCFHRASPEVVPAPATSPETSTPATGGTSQSATSLPEPPAAFEETTSVVAPALPLAAGTEEPSQRTPAPSLEQLTEWGATLASDGSREAVATLLSTIASAQGEQRSELARSLQALHSAAGAAELQDFLLRSATDAVVAVQARDALARIATGPDVLRISQCLPPDPDQALGRSYLLDTLGRVRNPGAVPQLAELGASPDPGLYTAAAIALGGIGTTEAIASLVALIDGLAIHDVNDPAVQALLSVRNKDAQVTLYELYACTTNNLLKYASSQALWAIQGQSSPAALPR